MIIILSLSISEYIQLITNLTEFYLSYGDRLSNLRNFYNLCILPNNSESLPLELT